MHPIILFGKEIVINPVLLSIGPIKIYWYGALIVTAFLISFLLIKNRIEKKKNDYGITVDNIYDFSIGMLIVAILSARLYYVIFNLEYYIANPLEIIQIWHGGIAIYGGIIGSIIYAYIFCKKKEVNFKNLGDLLLPYLALSQSIGRWGNFINQEAYGSVTDLPWKMGIYEKGIESYTYVHPTFFYESILNLILFTILIRLSKNKKFEGQIFYTYMIGYGVIRMFVEVLRADSLMLESIRISQLLSIVLVVIFSVIYYFDEKCRTK